MHFVAGAHAAAQAVHAPSTGDLHCLYVRSAGSNMQPSGGLQVPPKWKQTPAPPARQVKYDPTPGWNAQVVVGHPRSGRTGSPGLAGLPLGGGVFAVATGFFGSTGVVVGGCLHPDEPNKPNEMTPTRSAVTTSRCTARL